MPPPVVTSKIPSEVAQNSLLAVETDPVKGMTVRTAAPVSPAVAPTICSR